MSTVLVCHDHGHRRPDTVGEEQEAHYNDRTGVFFTVYAFTGDDLRVWIGSDHEDVGLVYWTWIARDDLDRYLDRYLIHN